jgi:hypothetical protein
VAPNCIVVPDRQPMGLPTQSMERLREYLAQLPPKAQALLMREFERAVERGDNVPVALLVLEQLRMAVRETDDSDQYRTDTPSRLMFRPIEPFLVGNLATLRSGQIRRSSLSAIWRWLAGEALPGEVREFEAGVKAARPGPELEQAIRKIQTSVADAIERSIATAGRGVGGPGGPKVVEDMRSIGVVLKNQGAFDTFRARIASNIRNLAACFGTGSDQSIFFRYVISSSICTVVAYAAFSRALANHPSCHCNGKFR